MDKRRVLLLCVQPLLGEGLKHILTGLEDVELIGPWDLDSGVLSRLSEEAPDIVIVAEGDGEESEKGASLKLWAQMFGLRSEESDFPAKSCTNWVISAHFGHDHLAAKERSAGAKPVCLMRRHFTSKTWLKYAWSAVLVTVPEMHPCEKVVSLTAQILERYPDLPVVRIGLEQNALRVYTSRTLPASSADLIEAIRGLPLDPPDDSAGGQPACDGQPARLHQEEPFWCSLNLTKVNSKE